MTNRDLEIPQGPTIIVPPDPNLKWVIAAMLIPFIMVIYLLWQIDRRQDEIIAHQLQVMQNQAVGRKLVQEMCGRTNQTGWNWAPGFERDQASLKAADLSLR